MPFYGVSTKWVFNKLGSAITIQHIGGRKNSSEGRSLATPVKDLHYIQRKL